jgi:hypothetical protein
MAIKDPQLEALLEEYNDKHGFLQTVKDVGSWLRATGFLDNQQVVQIWIGHIEDEPQDVRELMGL